MMNFEDRCLAIVAAITEIPAYFFHGTLFLETGDAEIGKAVYESLQINNQTVGIRYGLTVRFETFYDFV
jgi:hypothetical protein